MRTQTIFGGGGFGRGGAGGGAAATGAGGGAAVQPANTRQIATMSPLIRPSLALLWQIFWGAGFPNHFFCDSWVVGFLEGPTMVSRTSDWRGELGRWLKPFLDRLGHKARRQMCPLYVSGLIGPGDRKS